MVHKTHAHAGPYTLPVFSVLSLQQSRSTATVSTSTSTSRMTRMVDRTLTAGMHAAPER